MSPFHPTIAIAGATSSLGLHIVLALLRTPSPPKILIHTRAPASDQPFKPPLIDLNAHPNITVIFSAPYDSPEELTALLTHHNVHTLIVSIGSTNSGTPLPTLMQVQSNLLTAALATPSIKRFIPSEWECAPSHRQQGTGAEIGFPGYKNEFLTHLLAASRNRLEVGIFAIGIFMDYFSPAYMYSSDPEGGQAVVPPIGFTIFVDFVARRAHMFRDSDGGGAGMRLVLSRDIAKAVAIAVLTPDWAELLPADVEGQPTNEPAVYEFRVNGSFHNPQQLVDIGERLLPGDSFSIEYHDADQLAVTSEEARLKGDLMGWLMSAGMLNCRRGQYVWEDGEGFDVKDRLAENVCVVDMSRVIKERGEVVWTLEDVLGKFGA